MTDFLLPVEELACKEAIDLQKETLNLQWEDNMKRIKNLGNIIPMCDTSGSMECDGGRPLHSAIGLSCCVAEKSKLGKRIMTFSAAPTWVNLDNETKFTDMVEKISKCNWGMNTNFYMALKLVLCVIVEKKLSPEETKDMVLAIFSDMQIDTAGVEGYSFSLYERIEKEYENAGMHICGKPYKPPHILFWNLRSTDGFPSLSTNKNISMLSGFSPMLLNVFCEEGISGLKRYTAWDMMMHSLNKERFEPMEYRAKLCFKHI